MNEKGAISYFTERDYKLEREKEPKSAKKLNSSLNKTAAYFTKRRKGEVKEGRKPIYTSFNISVKK